MNHLGQARGVNPYGPCAMLGTPRPQVTYRSANVVYVKLSLDHTKAYIGATTKGVLEREATRRGKFKQGHTLLDRNRDLLGLLPAGSVRIGQQTGNLHP